MSELARMQQALARLVRAPEGVRAALREAGDPQGRSLADLLRGDAQLAALPRLEIYANAYFHRIREALAREYEALAEVAGPAGFHDLVAVYLLAHPSQQRSLRWVGAQLPGFLAGHAAAEPLRRRWPWAADVARLEWAMSEAFDAADAPLLAREDLAALPPAAWGELALCFAPPVRLLRLSWPALRLRQAPAGEREPPPAPEPGAALVWRRDDVVRTRSADALEAALLERALAGARFGALCEAAAERLGGAAAPRRAAELLGGWIESGLLARSAPATPPLDR